MKPIPLSAPDGTVYAWACGMCRHVRSVGESLCDYDDDLVADIAGSMHRNAERCCACRVCGAYAGSLWARRNGDVCDVCLPAYEEAERQRIAALPPPEADAPSCCPLCGSPEDE